MKEDYQNIDPTKAYRLAFEHQFDTKRAAVAFLALFPCAVCNANGVQYTKGAFTDKIIILKPCGPK